MGTDVLSNFNSIEQELERAKSNLKGLNDNIRRIIGRDPPDIQMRGDRKRNFNTERRGFNNTMSGGSGTDRNRNRESTPPVKRRLSNPDTKSVFSRLSGPPGRGDDEPVKPKLTSRVIKELPTRQEIVAAQGSDAASRARNRRMFGSLLGTLQKFCQEESRLKPKEEKKAQIEKKLEDQQKKERETLRKERQDLFTNRKRQQMEIKMLEMKMNRMKELSTWEEAKKPLMNFIRTKAKPRIYYLPKVMNKKMEKKLEESKADTEKAIIKKRSETEEELAIIANRFKSTDDKTPDNGLTQQEKDGELPLTKHDRRSPHEEDDENDSLYNHSDDERGEHRQDDGTIEPDISIVKQEEAPLVTVDDSKPDEEDNNVDEGEVINVEKSDENQQRLDTIKSENLMDEIVTLPTVADCAVIE